MKQYNKYAADCPNESELIAYKNGTLPEEDKKLLSSHLLLCDRCVFALKLLPSEELEYVPAESNSDSEEEIIPAALLKAFENYQKQISAKPKAEPRLLKDFLKNKNQLKVGQIWRTKLEELVFPSSEEETFSVSQFGSLPHLVVITNPFFENVWTQDNKKYQIIKIIPVSDNIEYAADGDVVFSEKESPLGYPFMLQIWNEQQMIMNNLDACLGEIEITPKSFKAVSGKKSIIDFLTERGEQQIRDADTDFSFFGLIKKGIYSNPKMRFRAMEFENTAYLREPVLALRESLNEAWEVEPQGIFKTLRGVWGDLREKITFNPGFGLQFQPGFKTISQTKRYQTPDELCQIAEREEENGDISIRISSQVKELADREVILSFVGKTLWKSEPKKLKPFDENWVSAKFQISKGQRNKLPDKGQWQIELAKKKRGRK